MFQKRRIVSMGVSGRLHGVSRGFGSCFIGFQGFDKEFKGDTRAFEVALGEFHERLGEF